MEKYHFPQLFLVYDMFDGILIVSNIHVGKIVNHVYNKSINNFFFFWKACLDFILFLKRESVFRISQKQIPKRKCISQFPLTLYIIYKVKCSDIRIHTLLHWCSDGRYSVRGSGSHGSSPEIPFPCPQGSNPITKRKKNYKSCRLTFNYI